MPRILKAYPKSCFRFTDNFIRMSLPSAEPAPAESKVKTSVKTSVETSVEILNLLMASPKMTLSQVAAKIGRSVRAIEMAAAKLTHEGKLRRVGSKKGGHWEVIGKDEG